MGRGTEGAGQAHPNAARPGKTEPEKEANEHHKGCIWTTSITQSSLSVL